MSSVHNHSSGLTINIYNQPPAEVFLKTPRGLAFDVDPNSEIEHRCPDDDGGKGSPFDKMPLPAWAKSALKSLFGNAESNMPSSADAAKTMRDFQKNNDINLLSSEQVKEMADTGYCTMPNGERRLVPPEVQAAAKKMMANNAELFKKLETAIRPEHDGLLSAKDYDTALKNGTIGKPNTGDLPTVKGLDLNAFFKFVMDGTISSNRPSEYDAAKTIQNFQKENNIKHLSIEQLQQMAATGYCTSRDGKHTFLVPPEVQAAAKKMMENNAELFKKLETSIRVDPDGLLSGNDVDQAISKGLVKTFSSNENPYRVNDAVKRSGTLDDLLGRSQPVGNGVKGVEPPTLANKKSDFGAIDTMRDFHKNVLGGEALTRQQFEQMAATGKLTKANGVTLTVPPEVQAAAKAIMDNNGALFDKLAAGFKGLKGKGANDGVVTQLDYNPAANKAANAAAKAIMDFQKSELGGDFITRAMMKEMAETGRLTKRDGTVIELPQHVIDAARAYMDNDAKLFKDAESWQDNKHDDKLSVKDGGKYIQAHSFLGMNKA